MLCSFCNCFSQENTYEIVETNDLLNIEEYILAMNKADFDSYRFIDQRRVLNFNTGVKIELLSSNELKNLGVSFDSSKAINYIPDYEGKTIYKLGNNGYIIAEVKTASKK